MSEQNQQGKPWEERVSEAGVRFEEEVKRVVRFLDEEVVPEVRRQGSTALRSAATQLQKLAEHMDDNKQPSDKDPAGTA